jgi:predicted nucleic acid-binding protein
LPLWVDVLQAQGPFRPELLALDPGERDALQLALSLNANRVLLDERAGSAVAERLGLKVTGTLGILRDAHLLGQLDGRQAYAALREQTNFRVSRSVEARFLGSLTR